MGVRIWGRAELALEALFKISTVLYQRKKKSGPMQNKNLKEAKVFCLLIGSRVLDRCVPAKVEGELHSGVSHYQCSI